MTISFKALIADDTQANRTMLRAYLGRLGFDACMAENGQQAVEMYSSEAPDLILMDLMMPVMDGFEAVRRIRALQTERWVPIFIISAMDAESDVIRGLEAGADDFLTKPLAYPVFAAKMRNVSRALELQRAREDAQRREVFISDAVIDGIITFDATGSIVGLNRAARQILGDEANALHGQHFASLVAESNRPAFALELARCMDKREGELIGRVADVTAQTPDGRIFPMEVAVSELPTTDRRLFIGVVRDISERKRVEQQLADDAARLQAYHDEAEAEAELAHEIMARHISHGGPPNEDAHHLVMPTTRFSGDIVLHASSPSGKLYALLADATGHGLAAAMSGLAVVSDFYRAVERDTPVAELLAEINEALRELLPVGRFVSTTMLCLDQNNRRGELWLGGMPDVLQLSMDGKLLKRFSSSNLPLGIISATREEFTLESFDWQDASRLLLCSDGVLEASQPSGTDFGYEGILRTLQGTGGDPLAALRQALDKHLGSHRAHDDMSLLLVDLK